MAASDQTAPPPGLIPEPAVSVEPRPAVRVVRGDGDPGLCPGPQEVVCEAPFVIEVDGTPYALMRTPGNDRELALGFLFTERLIERLDDIVLLGQCPDSRDRMRVQLRTPAATDTMRTLVVSSSCGLCGHSDIGELIAAIEPVSGDLRIDLDTLRRVAEGMRPRQALFQRTGGTHAAALFDASGRVTVVREDVGRHNALDKVIGFLFLRGRSGAGHGVFLSGRTSLEMVLKAARAGIPVLASVSAPTTAAVDAATRLGVTLCAFVRAGGLSVFAHEQRLAECSGAASGR